MEKFTVSYFIEKFEKIPDKLWIIAEYEDNEGRFCALGHCGCSWRGSTPESTALSNVLDSCVFDINDGLDERYQQLTPKERILAALYDVRAKLNSEQGVQVSDTTEADQGGNDGKQKERIVYVKVSKEIEEMELVEN